MPAYILIRVKTSQPEQLKAYQQTAPAIVAQYKGKFIVRGGNSMVLEGTSEPGRIVVLEFPNLADAEAFYRSPEYSAAKKLRDGIADFEMIAVEGLTPT